MVDHCSAWQHVMAVTRPVLLLAEPDFVEEIAERLARSGIQEAVRQHDTAPLVDHIVKFAALSGISNERAFVWDEQHGGVTYAEIHAALRRQPSCPDLRCFWSFRCGYRKGSGLCDHPAHQGCCPVPRFPLRKGVLNVGAASLYLFLCDVAAGDLVHWIDERLASADPGVGFPGRAQKLRKALIKPLTGIAGFGPKLWNMILAEILLVGDPARLRWRLVGESMIAADSVLHNMLQRMGVLRRLGGEHPMGPRCYAPGGCAEIIEGISARFDARQVNRLFPASFPRLVQHTLWAFGAQGEHAVCNGNKIDDRAGCSQLFCPAGPFCDRIPLR